METVSTKRVQEMKEKGQAMLVNVLDKEHFEARHIPGSFNIPLSSDDFEQRVAKTVGSKNKPVVVYCASEECDASPKAVRKLENAGFTQVYDYEGGTAAWKDKGLPVEGSA